MMLPLLTVLLSACGGNSQPLISTDPGTTPTYTLSGQVLVSATGAASLQSQSLSLSKAWQAPHVAGQVVVADSTGKAISAQSLSQSLSTQGLTGVRVQQVGGTALSIAHTPQGQTDAAFAAELAQRGLKVQPNYLYQKLSTPNDPGLPGNSGITVTTDLDNPISSVLAHQDYLSRINAQAAWDAMSSTLSSGGVVTAFLDTGVDFAHPDLSGRLLPGADCSSVSLLTTSNTTLSSCVVSNSAVQDTDGHGTGVAGLIGAAGDNGLGLTGVTWAGKNLLPIKVLAPDGASTTALAAGLNYAVAQNAKVINMSLGFAGSLDSTNIEDQALSQAISKAAAADVLMVAAAGNTPNDGLYYPASDPNVLAVGALGSTDSLACYSARPLTGQKALDLVAPGGNAGTGTDTCFDQGGVNDLLILALNKGYTLSAGTSEATPLVAGAAALVRSVRPDLSAVQVSNLLKSTAKTVAGGKLIDVGAAVKAAMNGATGGGGTGPVTPTTNYTLTVTAVSASTNKSYTTGAAVTALPATVPYTISGLPAGSYTITATLKYSSSTYTGQSSVALSGNTTQSITVK